MDGDWSRVVDGFMCRRCSATFQEADLAEDIMDVWMCKELFIWEILLIEMVEEILLLQLESEIDGRSSDSFHHF